MMPDTPKTYEVTATREGKWWMVAIPELGGLTQAREVEDVETMARDWIAITLDVPLDDVVVAVTVVAPEFEAFRDLAKNLLDVSKAELDAARKAESDAPRGPLPNRSRPALK